MTDRIYNWLISSGAKGIKSSGGHYVSLCPFHDDKKRSFSINAKTGQYICFSESCGEYGGLISFLMKGCNYSFKKAKELAEEAGAFLDRPDKKTWEEIPDWGDRCGKEEKRVLSESLLGLYDFCPTYLIDRGFEKSILRQWEVGYDFETKRVTIPVRDRGGGLLGISKRATLPSQENKYLHLQFTKSKVLYGDHKGWWRDTVFLTEGQLDAIAVDQMGGHAVSTMGAKVSKEQIRLLEKYNSIVLSFDEDRDGYLAAEKVGNALLEKGKDVLITRGFPMRESPSGGKWDPADLLQYGTDKEIVKFFKDIEPYSVVRFSMQ